ncbi:MAG: hypothetical protein KC619_34980 [Myxococcales bacterium]|nr:hypothetical protein [Myxococcales bacterium]
MRSMWLMPCLLAWVGCGGAPPRECPLPTAEDERAAFLERLEAMRAAGSRVELPEVDADAARALAPPTASLRVRVSDHGVGLVEGLGMLSWSPERLDEELRSADPMRLGWLLSHDVEDVVSLDADRRIPASARQGGAQGFLVPALLEALSSRIHVRGAPPELGLAIAPRTPFGTVAEVVYTAGQAGVERLEIVVRVDEAERAYPIVLPGFDATELLEAPLAELETPRFELYLALTAAGAVLAGSEGRLAPDCRSLADDDAPTLPGPLDLTALGACLGRVKADFPEEDTITITADSEVPFEAVARAAVAAAGSAQGLFPRTLLSAGVR